MFVLYDNARFGVDVANYPMVDIFYVLMRYKHKGDIAKFVDNVVNTLGRGATRCACRVDKLYICEVALLRRVAIEPLRIFDAWRALAKGNGLRLCSRNGEQSA